MPSACSGYRGPCMNVYPIGAHTPSFCMRKHYQLSRAVDHSILTAARMRSPYRMVIRNILQMVQWHSRSEQVTRTHNNPVHPMRAPPRLVHMRPIFSMEGSTVLVITAINTARNALEDKRLSGCCIIDRHETHFIDDMTSALLACRTSTLYADAGLSARSTYSRRLGQPLIKPKIRVQHIR